MKRIAISGGPGGGKTTAADLFRRELGHRVALVPEAATLLYAGGFPRSDVHRVRVAVQRSIYHTQRNLEDVIAELHPEAILLCDRGTVDGAAYWPGPHEEFFGAVGSSLEIELARYDAVIFFESGAVGGMNASTGNPHRKETIAEAAALDAALREIWARHPCFELVPHETSFFAKVNHGFAALARMVARLESR
jgi:hypothetical protein